MVRYPTGSVLARSPLPDCLAEYKEVNTAEGIFI